MTTDAEDKEIVLDEAGPGVFGELSMLTGEKRPVRVRATEEWQHARSTGSNSTSS